MPACGVEQDCIQISMSSVSNSNGGTRSSEGSRDGQRENDDSFQSQSEAVEGSKKKRKQRKRRKKNKGMESGSEGESMEHGESNGTLGTSAPAHEAINEETYVIEGLVNRRSNKRGQYEYLVRWKNYSKDDDTWEPRDRLLADGLTKIIPYFDILWDAGKRNYLSIAEFERRTVKVEMERKKEEMKGQEPPDTDCVSPINLPVQEKMRLSDGILKKVPEGRQLERIVRVTIHNNMLLYLVKWVCESDNENTVFQIRDLHEDNSNIILASVVNQAFPALVIKFYEENSKGLDIPNESHDDRVRAAEDAMEMAKRRKIEAIAMENRDKRYDEKLARGELASMDEDDTDDDASIAIAQEAKALDKKFDPNTSSDEDDDFESD